MARGMDDNFHRFLWVTLVVVAFTFTLILTSVFVDIDGLLAKRTPVLKQQLVTEAVRTELPAFDGDLQEIPSSEEDTDENESTYRTKRSLESNNYLLQIKNPKVKKILTNRLATLLKELDEEESSKVTNSESEAEHLRDQNNVNPKYLREENTKQESNRKMGSILNIKDENNKLRSEIENKDLLHIAMHNILLQGIKEHMALNEVYKRVQMLIKSFETTTNPDAEELNQSKMNKTKPTESLKILSHDSYKEEDRFFNELIKCEELQKQILQSQNINTLEKKESAEDSQMLIKTTIEIINKNNNNKGNNNFRNSKENTTGSIELVYNGKEIKDIDTIDDKNIQPEAVQDTQIEENQHKMRPITKKADAERQNINEFALDQAISEYLKTHSIKFQNKYNVMTKGSIVTKRLKRQIKIHYLDNQVTTEKSKRSKEKPKHHDDELYVEIETHFDGTGTKGEKKKKLVRTLIDKIQRAINSNAEVFDQGKNVQQKHLQIKKRMQNPIEPKEFILNTKSPIDTIEHRQLNPISKTANVMQPLTSLLDKSGDTWKKIYNGPGFLTASKSLNSAEMRELDIDYNSVMENGIPKRLQIPINTENDDLLKPNEYTDMGNLTLFMKDINGSGFLVGINQFTDEPPDKETLKMFTGLENLIQVYQQHYDQAEAVSNESEEQSRYITDYNHEIKRRDVNNQYTIPKQSFAAHGNMDKEEHQNYKYDFTQRTPYKRSVINVKLFSNIKSKTKLNKIINTNAMATKKIFHKSKRNKRQLGKIKLIASDHYPSSSREDVVLVSRENIYADRATVKEEAPEVEIGDRNEEHYDFIAPYSYNMDIPNLQPPYVSSSYDSKSLHTGLMSRYPHIFLENISRSKDFIKVSPSKQNVNAKSIINEVNDDESNEKNISSTNVDDIVNAVLPSRNNFKVVVKFFPKNKTDVGPGYKEVRTLINKSYDKNGVRYISSLNVSEISKFESLNKTKIENQPTENKNEMEHQQNQIKILLELHKERIDQQLEHLKMESKKLKQIFRQLGRNYVTSKDSNANMHVTTISNTFLVESETTTKSLFTTINKQEDAEKINIISSIKESENITRTILKKIDKNTDILQLFLQKLLDQKPSATPAVVSTEKIYTNDTPQYLVGEQVIRPFLQQLRTNNTNAIPFIYAFQHPLTEFKNKPPQSVANVIYHGHIHADKLKNDGKSNNFLRSVTNNLRMEYNKNLNNNGINNGNETRFFIDELENDFKLTSNVHDRIPVLATIKSNTTNLTL